MIKKTFGLLAIASLVMTISCKDNASSKVNDANVELAASRDENSGKVPVMTFEESEFDFGDIAQGEKVEHVFTFTNTGKSDLLITDAKGSCGCTVPDYKKEPIKPGEKGMVAATFNAASGGMFQKSVTITTTENGAEAVKTLSFKGKVLEPATEKKEEIKS